MDVKCENCGTEYEFDDAKVTAAGITVKCTQCGHLFKVARPAIVVPEPSDGQETLGPRPRHWMIRNRHGEIREFRDLSTLQQWIVERKVARDDEISKTGESWKPLGTIAELQSFFRAVGAAGIITEEIPGGSEPLQLLGGSVPPSPRAPHFGAEEVMPTGRFRLEGPRNGATPIEPHRISGPPMPSTPLDTNPTVPITRPAHPNVQVHRTPLHPDARAPGRTPAPVPALNRPFVGEPPPRDAGANRGFLMGVLATVAVAGIGYFLYDQLARPTAPVAGSGQREASGELYVAIERAEEAYERDTEEAFALADQELSEVIKKLGTPPRDRALAVRAYLGKARIAVTRAEYRKLEDVDPTLQLKAAEAALGEALALDDSEPAVALGYADFYRVQGSRQRANKFLAKVEAAGVDSDEANLVRAAVSVHNGDWAAAESRLGKLPPSVLEHPRARFLLAVSLARSGRTQEAIFELHRLLAHGEHGPARRLLERLTAAGPIEAPPSAMEAAPPSEAPPEVPPTAPPTAPATAPPSVAEVRPPVAPATDAPAAVPPKAVPTQPPAAPASARPVALSFAALMDKARKAQENGRNAEARRLILQGLAIRPDEPTALAGLGWCDVDEGQFPRAISYFRRALAVGPNTADARYGLGVALERSGQKAEALRAYQDYLARHPDGRRATMLQQRVRQLQGL